MRVQYVQELPVSEYSDSTREGLRSLGMQATQLGKTHFLSFETVRNRISTDLGNGARLSNKLNNWNQLDFASFRAEVKKVFKTDIPLKERADWETYLATEASKIKTLTAQMASAEAEINKLVYKAFDLTPDEILLLENSLMGQI